MENEKRKSEEKTSATRRGAGWIRFTFAQILILTICLGGVAVHAGTSVWFIDRTNAKLNSGIDYSQQWFHLIVGVGEEDRKSVV